MDLNWTAHQRLISAYKDKKMGKRIALVSAIVLLYQLSFANTSSAGFYDWLVSKESSPLAVAAMNQNRSAYSNNHIWDSINESYSKEDRDELKTEYKVIRESVRQVTAYNVGDVYQTDSTPCTGAYSKVNLCEELDKGTRICAANFVPLQTKLRITIDDESFECVVWDRMHSRFSARVDIAMSKSEKKEARQFGLQKLKVQILEEQTPEDILPI